MASKLKVDEISNVAGAGYVLTSAGVSLDLSNAGSALGIPKGTTAQRPSHSDGFLRFNTDTNSMEISIGSVWHNAFDPIADKYDGYIDILTEPNIYRNQPGIGSSNSYWSRSNGNGNGGEERHQAIKSYWPAAPHDQSWTEHGFQEYVGNGPGWTRVDFGSVVSTPPTKAIVTAYTQNHMPQTSWIEGSNDGSNYTKIAEWRIHPGQWEGPIKSYNGNGSSKAWLSPKTETGMSAASIISSRNAGDKGMEKYLLSLDSSSGYRYYRLNGTGNNDTNGYYLVSSWAMLYPKSEWAKTYPNGYTPPSGFYGTNTNYRNGFASVKCFVDVEAQNATSTYQWTGQVGDYAYPSQVWDYDRRSGTGNGFGLHGGHEGQSNFPHHVAIDMADSYPTGIVLDQWRSINHVNNFGYFDVYATNNRIDYGNYRDNDFWTLLATNLNGGGRSNSIGEGNPVTANFANTTAYTAYKIVIKDASRSNQSFGSYYGGYACYGLAFRKQ